MKHFLLTLLLTFIVGVCSIQSEVTFVNSLCFKWL